MCISKTKIQLEIGKILTRALFARYSGVAGGARSPHALPPSAVFFYYILFVQNSFLYSPSVLRNLGYATEGIAVTSFIVVYDRTRPIFRTIYRQRNIDGQSAIGIQ